MLVQAAPGLKVPQEFHPNRHITDAEPVEVIDSVYYQRRINDGDLVVVTQAAAVPSAKNAKETV